MSIISFYFFKSLCSQSDVECLQKDGRVSAMQPLSWSSLPRKRDEVQPSSQPAAYCRAPGAPFGCDGLIGEGAGFRPPETPLDPSPWDPQEKPWQARVSKIVLHCFFSASSRKPGSKISTFSGPWFQFAFDFKVNHQRVVLMSLLASMCSISIFFPVTPPQMKPPWPYINFAISRRDMPLVGGGRALILSGHPVPCVSSIIR